MTIFFFVERRS